MACDELIGCLLTSFGIPLVLVLFTIITHPLRIITLIISSSFWLVSFLFSSILWYAVVPLKSKLAFGLVFSVIFQEAVRFLFIYCLHKIDRGIKLIMFDLKSSEPSTDRSLTSNIDIATTSNNINYIRDGEEGNKPLIDNDKVAENIFNVTMFAYVGGLGFGLMSGLFASLNMLVALKGPGTLGYFGQSADFINFYAAQTLLIVLFHVAFHVVMSKAYQARSVLKIGAIVLLHMLYSCLTLANNSPSPAPEIVLAINSILCFSSCCWAFKEAGGRFSRIAWCFKLNFNRFRRFCGRICRLHRNSSDR